MKSVKDIKPIKKIETWLKEQRKQATVELSEVVARGLKTNGDVKRGLLLTERLSVYGDVAKAIERAKKN